jgi:hypothetical protein
MYFSQWGDGVETHIISEIVMRHLVNIFALMFNNAAVEPKDVEQSSQWYAIINVLDNVKANYRISEDLMEHLLWYGYDWCKKNGIIAREQLTQKVRLKFTLFYEMIDIFISLFNSDSLFNSNRASDRQERHVIRCNAVSRVYSIAGQSISDKHISFLSKKAFSLYCKKSGNVVTTDVIFKVSSQFINGMKKLVGNQNKTRKKCKHIRELDRDMGELQYKQKSLDDMMNQTFVNCEKISLTEMDHEMDHEMNHEVDREVDHESRP